MGANTTRRSPLRRNSPMYPTRLPSTPSDLAMRPHPLAPAPRPRRHTRSRHQRPLDPGGPRYYLARPRSRRRRPPTRWSPARLRRPHFNDPFASTCPSWPDRGSCTHATPTPPVTSVSRALSKCLNASIGGLAWKPARNGGYAAASNARRVRPPLPPDGSLANPPHPLTQQSWRCRQCRLLWASANNGSRKLIHPPLHGPL